MPDPKFFWLVVMNMFLGFCVVVLVMAVATGVACELFTRIRRRRSAMRELDSDMERYFGHSHSHK